MHLQAKPNNESPKREASTMRWKKQLKAISLAVALMAFGMALLQICVAQQWRLEFGNPKAKVKIEAFYPVSSPGHEWVIEYVKEIVKAFPNQVYAVVIDWTTPEGAKEFEKRKLSCGTFFINGRKNATVDGKRVEFSKSPLLGNWTKEQLIKVVAAEVKRAYGKAATKPIAAEKETRRKPPVLTAFVPCGVAGPYIDIKRLFEKRNPDIKLEDKIENVLVLTKHLIAGESPDIYITIGKRECENVIKKRGIKQSDIIVVAKSRLSLIVPEGNPLKLKSLSDLASDKVRNISLASPETSLGYCSQQALTKIGIWEKIKGKVAYAKFPAELKSWVQQRRVDAAIVYHPCLYEAHEIGQRPKFAGKIQIITVIAKGLHDEIPVLAIVMPNSRHPEVARKFVQFMLTEESQKAFEEWKFEPLKGAQSK